MQHCQYCGKKIKKQGGAFPRTCPHCFNDALQYAEDCAQASGDGDNSDDLGSYGLDGLDEGQIIDKL